MTHCAPVASAKPAPAMLVSEGPPGCTWTPSSSHAKAPHRLDQPRRNKERILNDITEFIGDTPMVRLNKVAKENGIKCELVAKCEFFNAGGSVKDRVALRMIEDGEREGYLVPGLSTIIEPSSGNTGVAVALCSAVKKYRCIIVMPDKMSQEKADLIRALGAEVVRTPSEENAESPNSHINVAKRLFETIPNAVMLNQYRNPANPIVHYDETAEEIWQQCDGKLDMVVIGTGTGGTICGIAKKFKEIAPNVRIVGVDPQGSYIAKSSDNQKHEMFEVEGIGYDFVPAVLDKRLVDTWVKVKDEDIFPMARELIRKEGLLCGGSSGAAVWAALQTAKELDESQRCVVILADSIRNYMTKHLKDSWMIEKNFGNASLLLAQKISWWSTPVASLPPSSTESIGCESRCSQVYKKLRNSTSGVLLVKDKENNLLGAVTCQSLLNTFLKEKCSWRDSVKDSMLIKLKHIPENSNLGRVATALTSDGIVSIVRKTKQNSVEVVRTVTTDELLQHLSNT